MTHLLLSLFGLTILAAVCNAPAWWRLMVLAIRNREPRKILLVRSAVVLLNAAVLFGVWLILSAALVDPPHGSAPLIIGIDRSLHLIVINAPVQLVLTRLIIVFAAEFAFLVASGDALREVGRRAVSLWAFFILAPVWALTVVLTL